MKKTYKTDCCKKVLDAINTMSTEEAVRLHNAYCNAHYDTKHLIFKMEDFDTVFAAYTPKEVADAVSGRKFFSIDDPYFLLYRYEEDDFDLVSFTDKDEALSGIDPKRLASYATIRIDALGSGEIYDILEEV